MRGLILALLAAVSVILAPPGGRAEEIVVASSSGAIYLVDSETGAARLTMLAPQMFDIATDPRHGMYGITGRGELYRFDLRRGAARFVGVTGVFVNALSFDRAGRLLGAGGSRFYAIDRHSAAVTLLGYHQAFDSSGDLAVLPGGAIYATGRRSAAGDVLYRLGGEGGVLGEVATLSGYVAVHGLVWSERGPEGRARLIGLTEANRLFEIDPRTGATRPGPTLAIEGGVYGAAPLYDEVSSEAGLGRLAGQ